MEDLIVMATKVSTKVKVEVLDSNNRIIGTNEIICKPSNGKNKYILTIGEDQFIVSGDGKSINRMFTAI